MEDARNPKPCRRDKMQGEIYKYLVGLAVRTLGQPPAATLAGDPANPPATRACDRRSGGHHDDRGPDRNLNSNVDLRYLLKLSSRRPSLPDSGECGNTSGDAFVD